MASRSQQKEFKRAASEARGAAETVALLVEYVAELSDVVRALSELAGPRRVQEQVCAGRERAMKEETGKALLDRRLRVVDQSSLRSLVCGRSSAPGSADVLPTYQQFWVKNSPPEATHLFVGRRVGDRIDIGLGQEFAVEAIYEELDVQ